MSDFVTRYQTADSRGLSSKIWATCPRTAILNGHLDKGWGFIEDFTERGVIDVTYGWTLTQAGSAGTCVSTDTKGGMITINAGHTDAGDGANLQRSTTVGEIFEAYTGKLYYECLLYMTACATADLFIGLATIDTTVMTNVPAISAYGIGFRSLTRDGVLLSGTYNASGTATGTGLTLVASTWYKLGFVVDKDDKAEFYVDGVLVNTETTYIGGTGVNMVPTFVCQSGGTNQPTMNIDWVACFQVEALARSTV